MDLDTVPSNWATIPWNKNRLRLWLLFSTDMIYSSPFPLDMESWSTPLDMESWSTVFFRSPLKNVHQYVYASGEKNGGWFYGTKRLPKCFWVQTSWYVYKSFNYCKKDEVIASFSESGSKLLLVIATTSFGMSIDCPDICWIIHWAFLLLTTLLLTTLEEYMYVQA